MSGMLKKIARKEIILVLIILICIVFYALFLKPNPPVRVDWNKVQFSKGDAILYLDAPSSVSGVGKKFTISVKLDTKGHIINAVQSYVQYDPRVLEIVKTDTSNSFCKFYPENNYNNDKGLIKLSCGAPYPGFRGTNTIQKIEFIAKAIKTTNINLTKECLVLANDGHGTNLLKEYRQAVIKIKAGL